MRTHVQFNSHKFEYYQSISLSLLIRLEILFSKARVIRGRKFSFCSINTPESYLVRISIISVTVRENFIQIFLAIEKRKEQRRLALD